MRRKRVVPRTLEMRRRRVASKKYGDVEACCGCRDV